MNLLFSRGMLLEKYYPVFKKNFKKILYNLIINNNLINNIINNIILNSDTIVMTMMEIY